MRILLIGAPSLREFSPPLSIYLLASILKEQGHSITIIDPSEFHKIDNRISGYVNNVDCICATANTFTWPLIRNFISDVREIDEDILIILGGLHPSLADSHILSTTQADLIVRGEGEYTLPKILEAKEKGKSFRDIDGITFKCNGKIKKTPDRRPMTSKEMEKTPLPSFEFVPRDRYIAIPVETSRGCFQNCSFCSIPYHGLWRGISTNKIFERIQHALHYKDRFINTTLEDGSETHIVAFTDDCFTSNSRRTNSFIDQFRVIKPNVQLSFEARITDLMKKEVLDKFSQSTDLNICEIQIGAECGYNDGLAKVNKGITIEEILSFSEKYCKMGLMKIMRIAYIYGLPWEGLKEILKTIHFAFMLSKKYGGLVGISPFLLLPGSAIWYKLSKKDSLVNYGVFDKINWFISSEYKKIRIFLPERKFKQITKYISLLKILSFCDKVSAPIEENQMIKLANDLGRL